MRRWRTSGREGGEAGPTLKAGRVNEVAGLTRLPRESVGKERSLVHVSITLSMTSSEESPSDGREVEQSYDEKLESMKFIGWRSRRAPAPSIEGISADGVALHSDSVVMPPRLRRQQRSSATFHLRPGAVSVEGRGLRRSAQDNLGSSTSSRMTGESTGDVLVQAQLVPERISSKVLATATPDPWWRRHQWWLAGATAICIVGIALSIISATVGLKSSDLGEQATLAPTSFSEGIEAETSLLIVSVLPSTAEALRNESTPQYEALQWVVQQRLDSEDSYYTETRVLQHYSLAALFLSTHTWGSSWHRSDGWLNSTTP